MGDDILFEPLTRYPRFAAVLSALCLVDMTNCIAGAHLDWPIPAIAALWLAFHVKPQDAP